VTAARTFARSVAALDGLVAFTTEAFAREGIEPAVRHDVDFVLEELFTNVVKYGGVAGVVRVEITGVPGGAEVVMIEEDAERFDPTRGPEVDVRAPVEKRVPGGLGLYLVRKLVDAIEYRYSEELRQGRITFRRTHAPAALDVKEVARD
jgi:anti-sigma regulatory factor (Ser/Thr protein kinase)